VYACQLLGCCLCCNHVSCRYCWAKCLPFELEAPFKLNVKHFAQEYLQDTWLQHRQQPSS
jgi:hypothetical protein